jgi:hypothetical protein
LLSIALPAIKQALAYVLGKHGSLHRRDGPAAGMCLTMLTYHSQVLAVQEHQQALGVCILQEVDN